MSDCQTGQLWNGVVRLILWQVSDEVLLATSLALLYYLCCSSVALNFVVALRAFCGTNNPPPLEGPPWVVEGLIHSNDVSGDPICERRSGE